MGPGRGILPDYSRQAQTYDATRAANPKVVAELIGALDSAPGRRLVDIGGGTGNYAQALAKQGWDVLIADQSPEMLSEAAAKGLATLEANAAALPLDDEAFDAALMLSMIHHVDDQAAALAEARRVLAPGGVLVLKVYTREDLGDCWVLGYFPSSREWILSSHEPLSYYLEQMPEAEVLDLRHDDLSDASLVALSAHPELLLEERWRSQTSYFHRLERDSPEELRRGLERLAADIDDGNAPDRPATTTLLRWRKS